MHKGKNLRKSKEKSSIRESKKLSKKTSFLRIFQKIVLFVCVFCAFFISPVFASLPSGYTELEYIESTGTQYIDTGIYADLNTKIDIDFSEQGSSGVNPAVFGSTESGDNRRSFFMAKNAAGTNWYANFDSIARTVIENPTIDKSRHNVVLSKNGWYYDNELRATWSNPTTWIQTNSIWLFARSVVSGGGTNPSKTRIYFAKLYQSDLLVRDLIPAKRTSDSVIGMYDTVSNTFFTNVGTGDFIAGPEVVIKIATTKMVDDEFAATEAKLATTVQTIESVVSRTITQTGQIATLHETKQTRPDESCPAGKKCLLVEDEQGVPHWYEILEPKFVTDGYTQLEYIESTGTQYIDTGIKGNLETEICITVESLNDAGTNQRLMGDYTKSSAAISTNIGNSASMNHRFGDKLATKNIWKSGITEYKMNKTAMYRDGELLFSFNTTTEFTTSRNLWMIGNQVDGNLVGYTYGGYIKDNGTLVRNFIPAKRNSDNEIGMYDTVSGTFFTNAGTGDFIAGPVAF